MPIQVEHFVLNKSHEIHPGLTLVQSMNAMLMDAHVDLNVLRVMSIDFVMRASALPLQIQLKHAHLHDQRQQLKTWYKLVGIDAKDVELTIDAAQMTTLIQVEKPDVILSLFNALGYEALLTDEDVCSAYQVDLLQLLIVSVLRRIIDEKSRFRPAAVEFDCMGRLSAVVCDARAVTYQLQNTDEVLDFLRHYARIKLRPCMVSLIRQQVGIAMKRYECFMLSPDDMGIQRIHRLFSPNSPHKWIELDVLPNKKVRISLDREASKYDNLITSQDRRLFQVYLSNLLGERFQVHWEPIIDKHYNLLVYAASEGGWIQADITHLQQQLATFSHFSELSFENCNALIGERSAPKVYSLSEDIVSILSCSITQDLPEIAVITPKGHTYDQGTIYQHLHHSTVDPITREPLTIEALRSNHLVNELIRYYLQHPYVNGDITIPPLLINPKTKQLFRKPIVLPNGQTIDADNAEIALYPNRCVENLIAHYESTLIAIERPTIRCGIRATIGVNVGLLCPGVGALSREDAENEADHSMPYVEYDPLTAALMIHVASPAYARRLYLGLNRWTYQESTRWSALPFRFPEHGLNLYLGEVKKNVSVLGFPAQAVRYRASVLIQQDEYILHFIQHICGLSNDYFDALKHLSGSCEMEKLNELLLVQTWDEPVRDPFQQGNTINRPEENRSEELLEAFTILSIRAQADCRRAQLSSQRLCDLDAVAGHEAAISSSEAIFEAEDDPKKRSAASMGAQDRERVAFEF